VVPAVVAAITAAGALAVLLACGLSAPLKNDEHQFIASAALLRGSVLPYRDFPYFHVPNLTFLYAALFQATDHLLLAARICSALCGWITLAVIFLCAWKASPGFGPRGRALFASGCSLLLLGSPLFLQTSVLAWNHALPTALALLAFSAHLRALRSSSARWMLASGLLLGLAAGTRLSFAPLFMPFGLFLLFRATGTGQRIRLTAAFCAGALLGLAPTLAFLYLAPDAFLFGNFGYAGLNTAYRADHGYTRAMTLPGKLGYFLEVMARPGNLVPLLLAGVSVRVAAAATPARARGAMQDLWFLLWLVPFLLVGSFAPSPSWPQYHYAVMPFSVMVIALALPRARETRWRERGLGLVITAALVLLPFAVSRASLPSLLRPSAWTPVQIHRMGQASCRAAGAEATVLTLAPVVPLEGGQRIRPELATGPFAWRTGYLLDAAERTRFHVLSPGDLPALQRTDPPTVVLLGLEPGTEQALRRMVSAGGFHAFEIAPGVSLQVATRAVPRVRPVC